MKKKNQKDWRKKSENLLVNQIGKNELKSKNQKKKFKNPSALQLLMQYSEWTKTSHFTKTQSA